MILNKKKNDLDALWKHVSPSKHLFMFLTGCTWMMSHMKLSVCLTTEDPVHCTELSAY